MNHHKPHIREQAVKIKWSPRLPEHWREIPVRWYFHNLDGKRVPLNSSQRAEIPGEVPYWGSGGIVGHIDRHLFEDSVLLVGEDGAPFFEPTRPVSFVVKGRSWINNHIHVMQGGRGLPLEWYCYAFNCVDYSQYIDGTTRDKLTQEGLKSIFLPAPPAREAAEIVATLDRETARIDALIVKKTRFIELLKEKRQALITQAVTKGLDLKVPMKDSGIEWIGEVPVHWRVCRLKYLNAGALKYGANESGDPDILEGPRYIRITDLSEDGSLKPDGVKRLPEKIAGPYMLEEGDILLARSGATVGKSFIYKSEFGPSCFAGYLIRVRLYDTQGNPDFISLVMQSKCFWDYIRSTTIQATIENVSAERYGDFALTIPSLDEQLQIVEWLSTRLRATDAITTKTRRSIELLTERRSALITAAVTGQIDLREEAA